MKNLAVTLVQSSLHWEDKTANLAMFEEKIWKLRLTTDVIVLPEMFSTGFSMRASGLAEMTNEKTFKWMTQMAKHTDALLLGSHIGRESGKYFNRLIAMRPDGLMHSYDKHHLFRMAKEDQTYSPGDKRIILKWRDWNICPMVCYDLRFPVWGRNSWNPDENSMAYDVVVYVANWPEARIQHWDTLLRARAIENLSYVVGVNRVGPDGNGVAYNGHSAVFGPRGDGIWEAGDTESIQTVTLDARHLSEYRAAFPAYRDADPFRLG